MLWVSVGFKCSWESKIFENYQSGHWYEVEDSRVGFILGFNKAPRVSLESSPPAVSSLCFLCEKVERAWVSPEWNITWEKRTVWVKEKMTRCWRCNWGLLTGPCVMNESVTFYIVLRCFHPVTSTNICWMQSKSCCCKWIGGYFSLYYFCISPLNKHWLREGLMCFSSELVSHSNKSDVYRPVCSCSHQRSCGSVIDWQVQSDTLLVIGPCWTYCLASALAHHYINIRGWPQRAESVVVQRSELFN